MYACKPAQLYNPFAVYVAVQNGYLAFVVAMARPFYRAGCLSLTVLAPAPRVTQY